MAGVVGFDTKKYSGALYYSKKQWRQLRDIGALRTFALLNDGKQIVEYTEMITYETLLENPNTAPLADDAEFRGYGTFSYHVDLNNKMVKVPMT